MELVRVKPTANETAGQDTGDRSRYSKSGMGGGYGEGAKSGGYELSGGINSGTRMDNVDVDLDF